MGIMITLLILAVIFAMINFMLPEATGFKGCLIFFILAFIVIFFLGSCVRVLGTM